MKALVAASVQRRLPALLQGPALLLLAACSAADAANVPAPARPPAAASAPAALASVGSEGMVAQIEPDAGTFQPAAPEDIVVKAPGRGRSDPVLVVEQDAMGGNMVRLHGRFSGAMQVDISQGSLKSECVTAGSGEAR